MFYSLRARLIIMFSVLLLVPLTTISWILIGVSTDVVGQLIRVSTSQTMDQYAEYVNTLTGQAEEVAEQILANETTQNWIAIQQERQAQSLTEFEDNMKMQQYLSMISSNTSKIESVGVFLDGRYGIWSFTGDFSQSDWYRAYRDKGVRWTASHFDKDQPSISMRENAVNSLIYPLTKLQTLQNEGIIKINLSTEEIRKPLDNLRLGHSGRVYLIQQQGGAILGQDLSEHADIVKTGLTKLGTRSADGSGGYVPVQDHDQSYLLFYRQLDASGWMLIGVVSEDELFSRISNIKQYVVLSSGGLLLLAAVAGFWLSSGVSRPLSKLASSMKFVERGDFTGAGDHMPAVKSRHNEVSYVILMYSRMINRLKAHIQLEVELNLRRRDAEYKALLLQINPHFLYNTLEVISSLSAQGRNKDVVQVTESLGRMLRYSLKLDSDLVNLKEELKYIHYFSAIMTRLYGERLQVSIKDDTSDCELLIPKFILQPLVENAFKFSMDHTPSIEVEVQAELIGNRLLIAIRDNGIGMDSKQVEQLLESAELLDEVSPLSSEGRRIGLRNVLARCRLYYGNRFIIRIDSAPGMGTMIVLELPREGNDDVSRDDR